MHLVCYWICQNGGCKNDFWGGNWKERLEMRNRWVVIGGFLKLIYLFLLPIMIIKSTSALPASSSMASRNICLWFQLQTMPCWVRTISQCQVLANVTSRVPPSARPILQNMELIDTDLTATPAFLKLNVGAEPYHSIRTCQPSENTNGAGCRAKRCQPLASRDYHKQT